MSEKTMTDTTEKFVLTLLSRIVQLEYRVTQLEKKLEN